MNNHVLESKSTKGNRYKIELVKVKDSYDIIFKTGDKITGKSCGFKSKQRAMENFLKRINEAKIIDGINYL